MFKNNNYRRIVELTDKEIKALINECIAPIKIENIERNEKDNEVYAVITTTWGDEKEEIKDRIVLTETDYDVNWGVEVEDIFQYKQYLFALGVNPLSFKNPYIGKV